VSVWDTASGAALVAIELTVGLAPRLDDSVRARVGTRVG
jgi:hypothetical protein